MTFVETQAPAGWYADPNDSQVERWWTGAEWSASTHASAKLGRTFNPPGYQRAHWIGPNRAAGLAWNFARASGALVLAVILGVFVVFVNRLPSHPLFDMVVGTVFGILLLGMGLPALVLGIVAARRSHRLGAIGLAVRSIVEGAVAILLGIAILTFLVLVIALAR